MNNRYILDSGSSKHLLEDSCAVVVFRGEPWYGDFLFVVFVWVCHRVILERKAAFWYIRMMTKGRVPLVPSPT